VARVADGEWLRLGRGRTLHHGAGLDRQRFPRILERIGARLLTGALHETRWTCPVILPAHEGRTSSAIHELVRFGK
jgi:hypothetical protein